MKDIKIKYGNWTLTINLLSNELIFLNKNLEDDQHIYDMNEDPINITIENEYVIINFDETYWIIKFESNDDLVIDEFYNDDEFIRTIGCYNIFD